MKMLAMLSCFVGALTVTGCNDGSSRSGSGGAGGSATGGATASTGGSSGGAGGAGAASCDATYRCAQAITPPSNDPAKLCAGSVAAMKFATLDTCLCAGACTAKCAASVCAQQMPSSDCLLCIMDTAAGCGREAADCSAN